ncbi:hypothetical protein B0T17DRAFT_45485 [Bombardia bombarda]|uniref:LPXTG-domain-containing protein n=1 Tax=Bombardia bombarda TaxID=252184 RepID=A0AA40CEP0_9PEZI|nr:hypothetical protein B0T17DRAFT_45485 [Bombardia bombarda]
MAPSYLATTSSIKRTLLSLLVIPRLASALQVTPNSPCASVCQDSSSLDISDPNSSNTRNSDITCQDSAFGSPEGTKWKTCMTCLQTSTFTQGRQSDQMWFLYNLRYNIAYCIFSFPNATGVETTPCSTQPACGPLKASMEHGVLNPNNMTTFSYCSVGGATSDYDQCVSCVGSGGRTHYLANSFTALEAGCQQQPAAGAIIGLNDTIFANHRITIVDPSTLTKTSDSDKAGLATPAIAGIAVGAVAVILLIAATIFVCCRKRKNKQARVSAALSFQCQTHIMSPRLWPGGTEGQLPSLEEMAATHARDQQDPQYSARQSSMWKPHNSTSSPKISAFTEDQTWESPYQSEAFTHSDEKAVITSTQLHSIRTSMPAMPPHAHASPSSGVMPYSPSDYRTPSSAVSTMSTSALLPAIKPYVPAEYGLGSPLSQGQSTFSSPVSAATTSPLLRNYGWADQRRVSSLAPIITPSHISVPAPPKSPRLSLGGKKEAKKSGSGGAGSPVESWEIQTAFSAPPKR